jgi:hypothetical protein
MTDAEIAAAYALVNATTPGPWRNGHDPSHFDAPEVTDGSTFAYYVANAGDAAFIAASRTLVPQLIAEVEQLRAVVDARTPTVHVNGIRSQRDEAFAMVERMRPVYEAAKTYIEGDGENDADELCRRLEDTVNAALAAEAAEAAAKSQHTEHKEPHGQ